MKRIIFTIMACLFFMSAASAETTRQYNHAERTFSLISYISDKYDDDMYLNTWFLKEYKLDNGENDITYSLSMHFDPTDTNKPMKRYEFFKDGFLYSLEGDSKVKRGAFSYMTDPGIGRLGNSIDVTIHEASKGNYTVRTEGKTYQYGGRFYLSYNDNRPYLRKDKTRKLEVDFYDDLMVAIRDNKELTLQIPYTQNLSNVEKIEFITFKISKATLKEWNDVVKFDLKLELQKLNTQ
ncbi:hypothetical protein [Pelosinus propionicus]|uniref:Uncharacterized protein n=1 Tax=Pelosinus propionicus DSM 13327 TaxID=1123291 RepID=A0A1I4QAZ8_9FIRM|nr:hypothetical protein [Pelosinus propionicus]SFM37204.1 hypothetical protein SAMN04490355_10919 [Pelosinus propionicus DSM 13327]